MRCHLLLSFGAFLFCLQALPAQGGEKDREEPREALRSGGRIGVGNDISIGALIGQPLLTIDYMAGPRWTFGVVSRVPLYSMIELGFEPRFFLSPKTPWSAYVGMSFSYLAGNIDVLLRTLQRDAPSSNARNAVRRAFLGGVQYMTPAGFAVYLEGLYQSVEFAGSGGAGTARFPSASLGIRGFFSIRK